jgi:hypothetical protein
MTITRKVFIGVAAVAAAAAIAVALFARGTIGSTAVKHAIEQQLSARLGDTVRIDTLGASFFPRVTLNMRNVSIGDPRKATIAEISIATGLRGLLSKRIEEGEIIVSNSRVPADMLLGFAAAAASGGPSAPDAGLTILSIRTLALNNVELVVGTRSLRFDLQASIAGDRLDVTRLIAQSSGTRLNARGALTSIAAHKGTFTATAGRLNLDELLAVASGFSSPAGSNSKAPVDVTIDLTAPEGELGGYRIQKLSSVVHVTPGRLHVAPLSVSMFGGACEGQLEVATAGTTPDLSMSGRVQAMDVSSMLQELGGSSSMSGRLSGTFAVKARGTSSTAMLGSAHGTGRATIADGEIPHLDMVRTIVLAFGKPSSDAPGGRGSRFTRIDSGFTLDAQTLRSQDITFASPDFDMSGSGSVRLPAGAVDMQADVVLSRDLTAQAGVDLRRYTQENGRIVVPATITGTLSAPSVRVNVAAAGARALENEVKRRIKGLLDRMIK